ncbi:MAG: LON peptidase substrate-binding domain-containing protein, partial [bacterium]
PPAIRIDFARPMALFPLPSVVVFPHTAEWLVAFEPRYRQLVEDCLRARTDGNLLSAAPFAMATYASRHWRGGRIGEPPLRPAVCVVKMVDHRALPDGRHQILIHGMARAQIETIAEPDGRRLYRLARLKPLALRTDATRRLPELEATIERLVNSGELARMPRLEQVRQWIRKGNVPTDVLVEQLNDILSRGDDCRYGLLSESNGRLRARFMLSELSHLSTLLGEASRRTPASETRGTGLN